jgi:hypothetical protein
MARTSRTSRTNRTCTVSVYGAQRVVGGQPTDWKRMLDSVDLTLPQIAAALVGGDRVWCEVCDEQAADCPQIRVGLEAELVKARLDYVARNARHGVTVAPQA